MLVFLSHPLILSVLHLLVEPTTRRFDIPAKFFVLSSVGAPLLIAILMFIGLLWKTKQDEDGVICLAPGHVLLKANQLAFSSYRDEFRPCPLYWMISLWTALGATLIPVALLLLGLLLYGLFWAGLYTCIAGAITIGILVLRQAVYPRLSKDMQNLVRSAVRITLLSIVGSGIVCTLFYYWPELDLKEFMLVLAAIITWATIVTGLLVGLWITGNWVFAAIHSTKFGQKIAAKQIRIKARWCPPVRACTENDFS